MNIRLKSLLSEILVLALAFSMTMPVSAAPYNKLKGEVSLLNGDEDEIDVNPGEVGSLGGWAVTEKNNKFRVYRSKNGDGEFITSVLFRYISGDAERIPVEAVISGNSFSDPVVIGVPGDDNLLLKEGDSITLDVDCSDKKQSEPVRIHINKDNFSVQTEDYMKKIIKIKEHSGTICLTESDGVFLFYNETYYNKEIAPKQQTGKPGKTVSLGGWAVTEKNNRFRVSRSKNGDGEFITNVILCDLSGDDERFPVEAVISGNSFSETLSIGVPGDDFLLLKEGDSITLDVDCSDKEQSEPVRISINKEGFSDKTEDLMKKVIRINENPGTICEKKGDDRAWLFLFYNEESYKENIGNNDEVTITGNPGEAVSLGGWTVKDSGNDNYISMRRGKNGDGDMLTIAGIVRPFSNSRINTTIKGGISSDPLGISIRGNGNDATLFVEDSITLDVDCRDMVGQDYVFVFIHLSNFSEDSIELLNKVIKIKDNPGTVCIRDRYNKKGEDGEEDRWVFKFYNKDSRKKAETGGWTVTDANVEGDEYSYIEGGISKYDENDCWVDITSPVSGNKPIDATIKGSLDSLNLELTTWDYDVRNKYGSIEYSVERKLSDGDHILIDVSKPDNARPGDNVTFSIQDKYFSKSNEDEIRKIISVKDNPGVKYELSLEKYPDEDGDGDEYCEYWEFYFEVTAQGIKESIVSDERKNENGSKTVRTQVYGDTIKMTGEKRGKKQIFSISGLKELKGYQKLTVNAGAKFMAEDLKDLDSEKVTVSFNKTDGTTENGTVKDVKKLFKINKKGQVTVKADKTHSAYTLMIPVEACTLCLTVVNINFDKKGLKDKKITALNGTGSTLSVNLVEFVGKTAGTVESEFLSADWYVDKTTDEQNVKTTDPANPIKSKKGFLVYLSKDFRTITIANPGTINNGNVKIIAVINGRKYTVTVKAKVK